MSNNKKAALKGYEKEYSQKTVKHRSGRVQARRIMEKKKGKAALKGKDVDHIDGNPNNNAPSNLRLVDRSKNRSDNGHRKGETYAKAKKGITNTFKKANIDRSTKAKEVLEAITSFSNEHKIDPTKALLLAGSSMYFHGYKDELNDIDFTHPDLTEFIKQRVGNYDIDAGPGKMPSNAYTSVNMYGLNMQTPEAMLAFYQFLNRPKDQAKIKMLSDLLNPSKQANMLNLALSASLNRYWSLIAKKKD